MKKLVAIVGTNSKQSTNRKLLTYLKQQFKDLADIELAEIKDFPLFDKPAGDQPLPEAVTALAAKIEASDGVIIGTPEYNHTIPSALRNALHWLSYHIYPLADKPVMITGASYGRLGSSRAQSHLRQILDSPDIRARVLPNSEFLLGQSLQAFDAEGNLKDPALVDRLTQIFEAYLAFIEITDQLVELNRQRQEAAKNFDWDPVTKEEVK